MLIACISDLHLLDKVPENRTDNILETQWGKLEYVLKYCNDHKIRHLFQAGDFFNKPRHWETLHKTISLIQKYPYVRIYAVEGQHDKYMRNDDTVTNLSLLHRLGLITILKNSIGFNGFMAHGINFEDNMDIDKAIDAIEVDPERKNILVIHAPISDAPLFPGHEFSKANLLLKKHKEFDLILCGDIHKEFICWNKDRVIVNTGCMIRKEKNLYNEGHQPQFYTMDVLNNETIQQIIIPHEPFHKVFSQQERIIESDLLGDFVEAVKCPVSDEMDVYKRINKFITDNNIDPEITKIIMEVSQDA
jgi:predicted phosphodiesterase